MNYSGIEDCSIVDGVGFRVVLFVSGCCHNCPGCHNPETHDYNCGKPFTEETYQKIKELLDRPYIQGLTFSGGDPLDSKNMNSVIEIAKRIREDFPNKDIWCYTGFDFIHDFNMDQVKVFSKWFDIIVDGPFIQELADPTLQFCGSSNQRIIDLKKSNKNKIQIWRKPDFIKRKIL